ncbi:hypothetical protein I0C86_39645 [Plantactinospora sp. S1510]|uniref:PIN domain-containing protein n=1 Tax=Plantactinospora alkalitolerans TaxID=2789879 RepID=A0ABS0H945_9ACTN|nr:hypothetical protein [Plantactinospora alkalitolerans]MBF9134995.1 hypothetical protein [Plantactinospora alkalitolerans]
MLDDLFQDPDGQPVLYQCGAEHTTWEGRTATIELLFDPIGHPRLPETDDEIIDRLVAAQPLAGREITLVTYDTGMATRARKAGLRVVKPPRDIGPELERQPRQPGRPKQRGQQDKREPTRSE